MPKIERSKYRPINNTIYDQLGERWYFAQDDPVALLRAEAQLRNSWVREEILARFIPSRAPHDIQVLDVGCGGGFLSNWLAEAGFAVDAVDLSEDSLSVARKFDSTSRVNYQHADACALPFANGSYDVVCAMDFLEHVPEPDKVIAEASRVLRPGGLFFYYTFNRNPISWLLAIKGVEWFVRNTPPDLHLYNYFIRPDELKRMCNAASLTVEEIRGARPVIGSIDFWKLLCTGKVSPGFRFRWTGSTLIAYAGLASKKAT